MRIVTDFHLHSRWSRACSKDLTIKNLARGAERKGIQFLGTSDFTHPAWRQEIENELQETEEKGVFHLRNAESPTRFLLSTEISCIYKRHGRGRRLHHLVLLSSLKAVDAFILALEQRGANLQSDGRPIIGLDSEELLSIVLEVDENGMLIPAHAWTPWFGIFGSQSGFNTLEECFGDKIHHIHAIETGLSSDPGMNWRVSGLDHLFLLSNSDAHSLDKLGREANVFEMEKPSYEELYRILTTHETKKFIETIEFFPEEGKYHLDGHRICNFFCEPLETKRRKGICPVCGKPLTVGVLYRVDELADRPSPASRPLQSPPYRSIIPLQEIVASIFEVGTASKRVKQEVDRILSEGRSEFNVLLDLPGETLYRITKDEIVEAILATREGRVTIRPGYDGEYGVIEPIVSKNNREQGSLF